MRLAVRCRPANGKVECTPSSFGLAVLHASFCKDGKTQGAWKHKAGSGTITPRAGRRHHTASEELPNAENASEGEAADTDEMAVDAGQETSKAKHRSQQRLASHGKAMGYLKGLVFKRRMDWSRATGEAAAGEATTSRGGRQR